MGKCPDQEDRAAWIQRRAVMLLSVVAISALSSAGTLLAAPQVQPAMGRSPAETSKCYAVQVGAYEGRAEATETMRHLMQAFPNQMALSQVVTPDKTRWRLRLLTTSKLEALKVSERLQAEQGIKAWIDSTPCAVPVVAGSRGNETATTDTSQFGSFLRILGADVPRWKAILSMVDVSSLSLSDEESKQIEQWRNLSLKCVDFVRNDTALLSTKVSLSDQIRLLDDLNRLASNASGLGNSLSYLITVRQTRDIPRAQHWARVLLDLTREILTEYQKFYQHLLSVAASIDSVDYKHR